MSKLVVKIVLLFFIKSLSFADPALSIHWLLGFLAPKCFILYFFLLSFTRSLSLLFGVLFFFYCGLKILFDYSWIKTLLLTLWDQRACTAWFKQKKNNSFTDHQTLIVRNKNNEKERKNPKKLIAKIKFL